MAGLIPTRKGAGQRRHFVSLQKGVSTTDAMGGRTQSWDTYARIWAAIDEQPLVVSEVQATVLYQVTMPFRQDTYDLYIAGTQLQVVTATKTLKVLEVINAEERNRDLVLHCARVAA
jgi:head-tail adaptor